jgi:hypothetical protein
MTLRICILGVLLTMLSPFSSEAQTPVLPARPPEGAVPSQRTHTETSQDAQNADLETYLRARLAVPGPEHAEKLTRFKALHPTVTPGVVAVEIENSWLRYHVRIVTAEEPGQQPAAYRRGDSSLDDILTAFAQLALAPRARVEASVRNFGLSLEDVYIPASAPYFNNSKGIVWIQKERRFVLLIRGVDDAASNSCFKAAIDLSTGDVVTRVSVSCLIQ